MKLAGKRVLVVGLGKSGVAAARLLRVARRARDRHRRARSERARRAAAAAPRSSARELELGGARRRRCSPRPT